MSHHLLNVLFYVLNSDDDDDAVVGDDDGIIIFRLFSVVQGRSLFMYMHINIVVGRVYT